MPKPILHVASSQTPPSARTLMRAGRLRVINLKKEGYSQSMALKKLQSKDLHYHLEL